jgi:hypothetical protein
MHATKKMERKDKINRFKNPTRKTSRSETMADNDILEITINNNTHATPH